MSWLLSRSSNCHSQHFCGVCKYMLRMDQSNGHNNRCSNHVFKVYAYCHHCSTVHEVPHRLGSIMMYLSNSALSNTTHCNLAHHHLLAVNNVSTFLQGENNIMRTMIVQLAMLLTMTAIVCTIQVTAMSHPPFSMVVVMEIQRPSSMDWMDISSTTIHPRTRLGSYLII